ncbi:metal-sulfur cluster assembly factor [Streptomyces yerevanensis]|uniref:metal-sulfur cluster assembly factor n=1 Tax=Streptomyces yerevanensis TaxID=66378 RepID=UPI0005273D94|nr:iron-sulfur cluster assembly protein [Streptomyces yerevanensis]
MSGVTEDRVREVLNGIVDPCSITAGVPAGMDDMGLISDIQVRDDEAGGRRVSVTFGLTDPTCMLLGSFANEARERLAGLPGVTGVDVTLDHDMEWTPDMLAPHYQERLAEHRAQRRRSLPLLAVTATGRAGDQ